MLQFDEDGRLLIHQRSREKITFPLLWTNTCCSHPLYVEDEMDGIVGAKRAIIRKLNHELGIPLDALEMDEIKFMTRIHYRADSDPVWGEHELDYVFVIQKNVPLNVNRAEIEKVKYLTQEQLREFMGNTEIKFSPWSKLIIHKLVFKWWQNLKKLPNGDERIHRFLKKFAIIGAGPAGIISAKELIRHGFDHVKVFEKNDKLGGVWATHYPNLHLQAWKETYQFPCDPMEEYGITDEYPSIHQVQHYLTEMAYKYDVIDKIVYNTEIKGENVKQTDDGWLVNDEKFDYVINCTGMQNKPYIPEIDHTNIIHSSKYDVSKVGNNVAVIGYGKSAMDIATDLADNDKNVTMIYRGKHWFLPQKIWGYHIKEFTIGRFVQKFLPTYLTDTVFLWWKLFALWLVKISVILFNGNKTGNPSHPIEDDFIHNIYGESPGFVKHANSGKIKMI
jgi:isopentenyl-diphosphate delta-isomerase